MLIIKLSCDILVSSAILTNVMIQQSTWKYILTSFAVKEIQILNHDEELSLIKTGKIENSDATKYWWGYRVIASVRYSWQEYKMVQAALEIVWKYYHITQQSHSWSIYCKVRKTSVYTKNL